jgi:hypothetical protein
MEMAIVLYQWHEHVACLFGFDSISTSAAPSPKGHKTDQEWNYQPDLSDPGGLSVWLQSGLGRKRFVTEIRDSLFDVSFQIVNLLGSSGVRKTLVGLEIDVPTPFLKDFSSALTPFVTNDRISISMAHEDWGLLFQISVM